MITSSQSSVLETALLAAKNMAKDVGTDEQIAQIEAADKWFQKQSIYLDEIVEKAERFAHVESRIGSNERYLKAFAEDCALYGSD